MPDRSLKSKHDLTRQADRSYAVMSFFLPFLILSIAYASRAIFPFGDKHILTVDLYHQYAPFLAELRTKILSGGSLFYSFAGGLGVNFYALFAYYLASPLNLILLLFPAAFLTEGILLLTLIKLSLAGFTFNIFLRKTFRKHGPLAVGFSTMYAVSSYVIAYGWNIMWLDSLYVAPLVILGLVCLIRDNKFWLYTLSLAYLLFVNFYMAWFVCLMTALLYFPFLFRFTPEHNSLIKLLTTVKTIFFTALGVGLSAFMLWPTYLALQVTSAANDTFPTAVEKVATLFDYFGQHLLLVEPTVRSGFPNLYSGILVLLLLPVAFLNSRVKLRDRVLSLSVIAFMVLSFSTNILNFIWHGFHYPNQLPYRNSFVYIFVILTFLYEALPGIRQLKRETIFGFSFTLIALIIVVEKMGENKASSYSALISIVFILLYTFVFIRLLDAEQSKRPVTLLLLAAIIAELIFSTCTGIYYLDKNEYFGSRDGYASGTVAESVRAAAIQLEDFTEDTSFFRTEVYPAKTSNDPFLYDLKGLTLFASTSPEKPVRFFKELGLFSNGINSYKYDGSNIVLDSLFGIRYLILRNKDYWQDANRYLVLSNDDVEALENPYALNLGYKVSPDVLYYDSAGENPLDNQNRLLRAMDPEFSDVFVAVPLEIESALQGNIDFYGESDHIFSFEKDSDDGTPTYTFLLTAVEPGTYNLAFDMRGHRTSSGKITVEDRSFNFSAKAIGNAEVGYLEAGQTAIIEISLSAKTEKSGEIELYAAKLDQEAFTTAFQRLQETQLDLTYFSDAYFRGKIAMPEAGVLLLTIPHDRGWTAEVDGKPQAVLTINDSLMALELEAGEHTVEMSFLPYGFRDGATITLIALAILLMIALIKLIIFILRRRKSEREQMPLASATVHNSTLSTYQMSTDQILKNETNYISDKGNNMKKIRFYYCDACTNLVVLLNEGAGELICCDEPMELLEAKTTTDDVCDHILSVEKTDRGIIVKARTDHEQAADGVITWVAVVQGNRYQICFPDQDEVDIEFILKDEPAEVYEFCTVHGLWKIRID
ncbi:MAG: YfhO family protein [Saccharofermentanales bacterium]|jgi:desulfoferrodoxin